MNRSIRSARFRSALVVVPSPGRVGICCCSSSAMPSTWFLQDTTNNAGASKSKRIFPFHILPLSLSSSSDSHASTRKSRPICTLSLEHATCGNTMDVSIVPFPSSEVASIDSQSDIECRPHKLRRFSQDTTSGVQEVRQQSKRRRSASSSRRHSLLSPTVPNTCPSSPLRTRSNSFSHCRQLTMRETTDLRFIATIRKSVLSGEPLIMKPSSSDHS